MATALKSIERIERVTLGDRVYAELRDLLMAGKLLPEEKLSLRVVAESLGVSMMPVREAVSRLVADEALTVLPNRAVSIPRMTQSKLTELTTIRIAIEGFAAHEAASRRTDKDVALIRKLDERFRRAVKAPVPNALEALRYNKDFHFAVYAASGLPSLVTIIEGLWLKIGPVINLDLRTSQRLTTSGAEGHHGRLVEAVARRDADAAREALTVDIRSSAGFILASGQLPA